MSAEQVLAERFETHRARLRAVAYRMLGSWAEADDAVQDSWVRLSGLDPTEIDNLGGWLTTVVGWICLNMLRSRRIRREDSLAVHVPDSISRDEGSDPESQALVVDAVGLALMVVLDTLEPAERLAFVLHDLFELPFDQIALVADRSRTAVRKLASRARRRVVAAPQPDVDLVSQRRVVDAFFAAVREGDFEALIGVLDPDLVLRADGGTRPPARTELAQEVPSASRRARLLVHRSHLSVARCHVRDLQDTTGVTGRGAFAEGPAESRSQTAHPSRQREVTMSVLMVRAKVKSESVAEVETAAKRMFEEIHAAKPQGVRYASYKLPDGVTYVAVLVLDEGMENPLPQIDGFRQFQEGLRAWVAEPPAAEPATVIGSYE